MTEKDFWLFLENALKKGRSVLFEGHDKLPTQEALNALREYNKTPDEALKYIAHFALEECEWWNK